MNKLAYQHGFVEACVDEGFTVKEASKLYDYAARLYKFAQSNQILSAPNEKKPPLKQYEVKRDDSFKFRAQPSRNLLPPTPQMVPGARTTAAAPHYNPQVEQVPY